MARTFSASGFFFPGLDDGLAYLDEPGPALVRRRGAKVRQIPAAENAELNRKMRQRMEARWRTPTSPPIFETLSSVVQARNVSVAQRKVKIGGKLLLSAAAGDRVWKSVLNKLDDRREAALNAEMAERRAAAVQPIPAGRQKGDRTPFVVDARNGYNFYHFLTEALPQLAVIAQVPSRAPIYVHMPDVTALSGFVRRFIEAIYPDLARRVIYTDVTRRHEVARLVYNHRHYVYQSSDPAIARTLGRLGKDDPWHTLTSDRASRKFLLKSTFDTGMRLLRQDALARIETIDRRDFPTRLWLGRDPDNQEIKSRPTAGEAELLADLTRRGFQVAYMENLSPLQQIAMIHGADMIVGPHGAAFAHMMFARPSALVLEIGTAQTQAHRWGDFLGNAHVAGCTYTTIFADVEGHAGQSSIPPIETGHHGIHIGDGAADRILGQVDRFANSCTAGAEPAVFTHSLPF